MSVVERSTEAGIANRRAYLEVGELVETWKTRRPRIQRSVSVAEALHRPSRIYSDNGVPTPQGWILNQLIPFPEQLLGLSQQQSDELMAQSLRWPRAQAVLVRHLMNLHPGNGITRRESIVFALTRLDYHFGATTGELLSLASRIDALTQADWEDISERLIDLKSQSALSLLGSPLGLQLTSPLDLTKITEDAFRTAAKYAVEAAYGIHPAGADAGYFDPVVNDVYVAAGRAALEVLHRDELRTQGHNFVYKELFMKRAREVRRVSSIVAGKNAPMQREQNPATVFEVAAVYPQARVIESPKTPRPPTRREALGALAQLVGIPTVTVGVSGVFYNSITMPQDYKLDSKSPYLALARRVETLQDQLAQTRLPESREVLKREIALTQEELATAKEKFELERREKIEPGERKKTKWGAVNLALASIGGSLIYLRKKLDGT